MFSEKLTINHKVNCQEVSNRSRPSLLILMLRALAALAPSFTGCAERRTLLGRPSFLQSPQRRSPLPWMLLHRR